MSIKEEYIDRVEKYLRGELTASETSIFERELSRNESLKETLEFVRDVREGIEINTIQNLKLRLQKLEKKRGSTFKWLAVAASIALIASVGYFAIKQSRQVDASAIYSEYYSPYPNIIAPTSRSGEKQDNNLNAYQLYEQESYQAALKALEELENSDTVRFYQAQVLLSLERDDDALRQLASIKADSKFSSAANWYEALIYLKQQNKEKALKKLTEIVDKGSDYSSKAEEIKKLL